MRISLALFIFQGILFITTAQAQKKYFTKGGEVSFFSKAPLEDIEAHNTNAISIVDFESGNIEFAVLIKAFKFEKALMQEHFNENYLESSKFPKAFFKGKIVNYNDIYFLVDGTYSATIKGKMTIHGVSKDMTIEGNFRVEDEQILGTAKFPIEIADHNIRIPRIVRDNIADKVDVNVVFEYQVFRRSS